MELIQSIDYSTELPKNNAVSESNKRRVNKERNAAILAGENVYFTGKPCKYGHISNRYVTNSQCVECLKIRTAKTRERSPDTFKDYNLKSWLKKAYNISVEEYKSLLKIQNNKCSICEKDLAEGSHVDHCHNTGKIRGILCPACNKGIGHFYDSPDLLIKAAEYCKKHEK